MQINFSIITDKSPGILARVIVTLRQFNLNLTKQALNEVGENRVLKLVVQGADTKQEALKAALLTIPGVQEIVFDGATVPVPASAPVESRAAATNEGSGIAHQIAQAFPNIGDLVANHQESLNPEHAAELLFALGLEVAALRKAMFAEIPHGASIEEFIAQRLIPDVRELGSLDIEDGALKVLSSVFTKTKKAAGFGYPMGGADTLIRCDFLSGYIQGVLEATPDTKYAHVEETMCRKEGQPYCLFEFVNN